MKELTIGVIADTHYPEHRELPLDAIRHHFSGVELILHAGDLVSFEVLRLLERIAPVEAVAGNSDYPVVRARLPDKKTIVCEGVAIGIVHRFLGLDTPAPAISSLFPERAGDLSVVVFGHTHAPFNQVVNGILLFNPGSPCTPRGYTPSLGLLKITAQCQVLGSIISLQ